MGHVNQYEWVRSDRRFIREPVLEIGSRHYDYFLVPSTINMLRIKAGA